MNNKQIFSNILHDATGHKLKFYPHDFQTVLHYVAKIYVFGKLGANFVWSRVEFWALLLLSV